MLVLKRKEGEEIVITHGNIVVRVVVLSRDTKGRTKLGIEAPADVDVHRLEVYEAIKRQEGESIG